MRAVMRKRTSYNSEGRGFSFRDCRRVLITCTKSYVFKIHVLLHTVKTSEKVFQMLKDVGMEVSKSVVRNKVQHTGKGRG